MNREIKEDLLQKRFWSNKDIQDFTGCGITKASKIHQEAIKHHNGLCKMFPRLVKRDSVLEVLEK